MQAYSDLVELARICLKYAREATVPSVRDELNRMAREYQQRAAKLDGREPNVPSDQTAYPAPFEEPR
jgi:hypothetical protein